MENYTSVPRSLCSILGVLACAAALPARAAGGEKTVKIAVEFPIMRWFDETAAMAAAAQSALDERDGKVCGDWTVKLQIHDQSTSGFVNFEKVRANARRDAADRTVGAILGTYTSGAAYETLLIINESRLLMVSPSNTSPCLTLGGCAPDWPPAGGNRNYARVIAHDGMQGRGQAIFAGRMGTKSAFLVHIAEFYGETLGDAFVAAVPEGVKIAGRIRYDHWNPGFGEIAEAVVASGADLVVSNGFDETGELIGALRDAGFHGTVMVGDGAFGPWLLEDPRVTGALAGTLAGLPIEALGPEALLGRQKFTAATGREATHYTPYSHDATKLILSAFEEACAAGSVPTDRAAVSKAALAPVPRAGLTGPYSIDEKGDTTNGAIAGYRVVRDATGAAYWVFAEALR